MNRTNQDAGLGNPNGEEGFGDFLYMENTTRFEALWENAPEDIPGYSEYGKFPVVVFDMEVCQLVGGGENRKDVMEATANEFGPEYLKRYMVIPVKKS